MRTKSIKFLALVLCVLLSGCSEKYPSLQSLLTDYLAQINIKRERYEEALSQYYDLLEEQGGRAELHSNIGALLSLMQKPEDAIKSLRYAEKLASIQKNEKLLFAVHYNLGVVYGQMKNVADALKEYQAALDIVPTSKEAKTNIELLMQQQEQDQKQQQQQQDQKNGQGQSNQQNKDQKQDQNKDQKQDPKQDQNKDKKDDQKQDKKDQQKQDDKRESSPRYKPRPFKGDDLSEGDVKKILEELRSQEQKIRAHFDKKEKGSDSNNGKDW